MFDYSTLAGMPPEDQKVIANQTDLYQARELPLARSAQEAALTLNPINQVPIQSLVGAGSNLSPETQSRIVDYLAKINAPPVAAGQQQQQPQEPYHGFAGTPSSAPIVRIKNPDGTITYSNNPIDIGSPTGTNLPYLLALVAQHKARQAEIDKANPKNPVVTAGGAGVNGTGVPVMSTPTSVVTPLTGLAWWLSYLGKWLSKGKPPVGGRQAGVSLNTRRTVGSSGDGRSTVVTPNNTIMANYINSLLQKMYGVQIPQMPYDASSNVDVFK